MPVIPTYPGVYIEEVPSTVRTIAGVSTSVTAFVGRAQRGPVNEPVVVNGYAEFETAFGGLSTLSRLGYSVRDFFINGGSQAIIVRLYHAAAAPANEKATLTANGLALEAASPGAWGNFLKARIDDDVRPGDATLFNLFLRYAEGSTVVLEEFRNVSWQAAHPRYVGTVLENELNLAHVTSVAALPTPHADPDPQNPVPAQRTTLWGDEPANTGAAATHTKVAAADEASDGDPITDDDFIGVGFAGNNQGLYALNKADIFNLLVIPPYNATMDVDDPVLAEAAAYCEQRRAFMIIDSPSGWTDKAAAKLGVDNLPVTDHAAVFFPRIRQRDTLKDDQFDTFTPSGAIAGVFARTDAQRGVWKAPAGLDATLNGVPQITIPINDGGNGELNPLGINVLRTMPGAGRVIWGARTRRGSDRLASQWKYIPIRRLALFIEESLYRGTQWVVFEPNDEPLWAQIRLNVGAFMHTLFRQGAFQGSSPKQAYFVKCDKDTTPQADIDRGIVNIIVGFAPLKPAEFVIIKIQQIAGDLEV